MKFDGTYALVVRPGYATMYFPGYDRLSIPADTA